MKNISDSVINEIAKANAQTRTHLLHANYKMALDIAKSIYRKYPNEPFAKFLFATFLGDTQEGLSKKQIEANRIKVAKILKDCVAKIDRIPSEQRNNLLNEYYWFSKQPLKQYRHGVSVTKKNPSKGGYYSMGVGSAKYAEQLLKDGSTRLSKLWAQKSLAAWEKYIELSAEYYNAYCWQAFAHGIHGNFLQMEKSLDIAQKKSGKTSLYAEFMDVRCDIYALHRGRVMVLRRGRRKSTDLKPN